MKQRKLLLSTLSFAACLFATLAMASVKLDLDTVVPEDEAMRDSFLIKDLQPFQLRPTLDLWALGGKRFMTKGLAMWPFFANSQTDNFFGAMEGSSSFKKNKGWTVGLGTGYRKVVYDSYIVGGYLWADYSRSANNYSFWVANPGIEVFGYSWDFRANAYVPLSSAHWYGDESWADEIGINNFVHFKGYEQFDAKFRSYEETRFGVDAEVGTIIPYLANPRIYAGGYHFQRKTLGRVSGAEGRLVYPVGKYFAVEGRASYDNEQKTVLMFGLRFSLGGFTDDQKRTLGVAARLTDPIEHNFATFANGNR
jgi:hypothetical protein